MHMPLKPSWSVQKHQHGEMSHTIHLVQSKATCHHFLWSFVITFTFHTRVLTFSSWPNGSIHSYTGHLSNKWQMSFKFFKMFYSFTVSRFSQRGKVECRNMCKCDQRTPNLWHLHKKKKRVTFKKVFNILVDLRECHQILVWRNEILGFFLCLFLTFKLSKQVNLPRIVS